MAKCERVPQIVGEFGIELTPELIDVSAVDVDLQPLL
jgi:hypothetical protein